MKYEMDIKKMVLPHSFHFSAARGRRSRDRWGLAFALPSLAGVLAFYVIPYLDVVRRAFVTAMTGEFAGLSNFRQVLGNPAFRLAAANTAKMMGVSVPILVVCSLMLAVPLQKGIHGGRWFKSGLLIPMAIPAASVVLLWQCIAGVLLFGLMISFTIISRTAYNMSTAEVSTEQAEHQTFTPDVSARGTVTGSREIAVSTVEGLRVGTVHVMEGQAVEAGEILFEVDLQDLAEKMKAKQQDLQSLDLQIRGAVESEAAEERSGQLSRSQAQWYWIWRFGMAVSSAVPYRKSCLAGRIPASLR